MLINNSGVVFMVESFYNILAKSHLTEDDIKKLERAFKRLEEEEKLLEKVFLHIPLERKRILDMGTGQGFACKFLVDHAKESIIITVDKDPLSLNRVRNVIGEKIDDIIFMKADLTDMTFIKDNYFDIALSHYTLSAVDEKELYIILEEVHRVLVPNGILVIVEGFNEGKKDIPRRLTLELEEIYYQITGEFEEMRLETFLSKIKRFRGFRIVEVKKLDDGLLDPTIEDFAYYLLSLTKDESLRRRIIEICEKGKIYGFRESPNYAFYLKKQS